MDDGQSHCLRILLNVNFFMIGILSIISCHFTIDSEKSPCGNREIRGGKDEVSVKNHEVSR